jgi:hypothetical protein
MNRVRLTGYQVALIINGVSQDLRQIVHQSGAGQPSAVGSQQLQQCEAQALGQYLNHLASQRPAAGTQQDGLAH